MAEIKDALDFSNMFAKVDPVQPVKTQDPVKSSSVDSEVGSVDATVQSKPESKAKTGKKANSQSKKEVSAQKNVEDVRISRTIRIEESKWDALQIIATLRKISTSELIEQLVDVELKKNASLIEQIKNLQGI